MVGFGSRDKLAELFEDPSGSSWNFPDEQCAAQSLTVCSGDIPGICR